MRSGSRSDLSLGLQGARSTIAVRAAWIVLSLLLLGVALRAAHPIANPDFGWHVALGRFMLEHASVPATEPFTHTAAGRPMVALVLFKGFQRSPYGF